MISNYEYNGPLNGGYAIQDPEITRELKDFCENTYEWQEFFAANGVTDHRERFIETFKKWIGKTEINSIKGLDAFSYVTQTNGTSEAFQMFMLRHNKKKFKFVKGDFMMHKIASNVMGVDWEWIYDYNDIEEHDAVIISCPFSDTGGIHADMENLLQRCNTLNVPVLIDMAYFGMCYGLNIDVDQPCVEEVTFSLGKTFPLIGARPGVRFQRKEIDDPVLFANQHGIVNNFGAMIGEFSMSVWNPDFIANKYMRSQLIVCNKLELKPTNCVIFALSNHGDHVKYNRGNQLTRLCISKLLVEEYERS